MKQVYFREQPIKKKKIVKFHVFIWWWKFVITCDISISKINKKTALWWPASLYNYIHHIHQLNTVYFLPIIKPSKMATLKNKLPLLPVDEETAWHRIATPQDLSRRFLFWAPEEWINLGFNLSFLCWENDVMVSFLLVGSCNSDSDGFVFVLGWVLHVVQALIPLNLKGFQWSNMFVTTSWGNSIHLVETTLCHKIYKYNI